MKANGWLVWSFLFASALATGQSAPGPLAKRPQLPPVVTASDSQAESAVSQAINAAGGPAALSAIQDYTATGRITYYWAGKEVQGPVTLRGRGFDQFRLDASLPEGTRSWAVSNGVGKLKKEDGTESSIPGHNAIAMGSLTFPAFYLAFATSAANTTVSTVPASGASAIQVRVQRHYATSYDPNGTIAQLTSRDYFIDPSTYLVVQTEVMTHPKETFTVSLPEDVYFSDYQRMNGVMVPFTITDAINGQKIWTIQLSSVTFNSGLTDANFSL